ncbi:MAG: hypothetical protein AAFO89_01745, partial [Planctomycetota bacterium]
KQDQVLGAPDPATEPTHPAPKPLTAILGHDRPISQLTAAIESERLHHAWVFHGPKGVGKLTTALAFAALVLDPTTDRDLSGNLAPDPTGRVQSLLQAGTHPDLHVITKELARFSTEKTVRDSKLTTIPKDVVETHLLRPAALAPQLNEQVLATKVFIVNEAELLDRSPTNAPVQNALLKTLEEPAPGTLIILVTSDEQRLLPTIRSRCQRIRFAPLPDDAMQHWASTHVLTPDQADWALRFGQGSPGLVLEAIATGQDRWRARIEPMIDQLLSGRFPIDLGPEMHTLVQDWAAARIEHDKNASKDAANRAACTRMLALVGDILRDRLRSDPAGITPRIATIDAAQGRINANVNLQMVFDALAAELTSPPTATIAFS